MGDMENTEATSYQPGAALFGYDRLTTYREAATVDWTDPDLHRVVRLKLVTDPGLPFADVSYCYGDLTNGQPVRVRLPFHQLPRRGMSKAIVTHAMEAGVHAKRLGILDAVTYD
jgi:hypothetical protein